MRNLEQVVLEGSLGLISPDIFEHWPQYVISWKMKAPAETGLPYTELRGVSIIKSISTSNSATREGFGK
jgi:hypothetical protein